MTRVTLWIGFNLFVALMLALDLGLFHKTPHKVGIKEATVWSGVWVCLSLLFNLGIYAGFGPVLAGEYLTAYVIEKSLSVDNVFVFYGIFTFFRVPLKYQHRVLHWGVIGALVMRAAFIFGGIELIQRAHWVIYLFGGFLVLTGIRMSLKSGHEMDPEASWFLKFCRKILPVSKRSSPGSEGKFFIKSPTGWFVTPLFLVLLLIEVSDILFAVDSIPAVLAISKDPLIVYTSNVFAIMGLRSLFFALTGFVDIFEKLHYGLSAILIFVGVKMLLEDIYPIPTPWVLATILTILLASVFASFWGRKQKK